MTGPSADGVLRWRDLRAPEMASLDASEVVVIVPVGSIEQHGPHLRLDEDIANALALAELSGTSSPRQVIVAPPVWWGMAAHHMGFAGTISLRMETMTALVADICASIAAHGFRRVLLLNGHGGNQAVLTATAAQASADLGILAWTLSYWALVPDVLREVGSSPPGGMGHAGEMETSLALHLRPDTVDRDALRADIPASAGTRRAIDFRSPGPVAAPLDLRRDSREGVLGDPTDASAEKGAVITDAIVGRLVEVIDDLATFAIDGPEA